MRRRDSFVSVQLGELSCNPARQQLRATIYSSAELPWEHDALPHQNTVYTKLQGEVKPADSAFTAVFVSEREHRCTLYTVSSTCAASLPALSPSLASVQLPEPKNKDGIK